MPASPLSEARNVWVALLRSGTPCDQSWWRAWADTHILSVPGTPATWLAELCTAYTHEQALQAVVTDLGLDNHSTPDPEALLIGFVAARHFNGELAFDLMWSKLCELTDIAEFIDSRRWETCTTTSDSDPRAPTTDIPVLLTKVANFAVDQACSLLAVGSYGPNNSFKPTPLHGAA